MRIKYTKSLPLPSSIKLKASTCFQFFDFSWTFAAKPGRCYVNVLTDFFQEQFYIITIYRIQLTDYWTSLAHAQRVSGASSSIDFQIKRP